MSFEFEQSELVNGDHINHRQHYSSTSLKTLLALDLSCGKVARLEHDLDKVANILNLPNDWRLKTCSTNAFHHEFCQARAEWCLRWLLKALCTSDPSFTNVRANASLWILLGRLIAQLPVSLIAKALSANAFVKCLKDTLLENYSQVTVDNLGSRLKNSEHNGDGEAHLSQSNNDKLEPENQKLFPAINEVFGLIVKLALNRSGESLANEHVKLSLRCDLITAAYITRLYIMGLNDHLLNNIQRYTYKIGDDLIAPITRFWEMNLEDTESLTNESSTAFAFQCTLPLLYTIIILEEPPMDMVDKHDVEISRKTRSFIQFLITKYSLSCASAHLIRSRKEREHRQSLLLEPIIKEIKFEIKRILEATDEEKVDSGASLTLIASTVPLLFKLIVKSNFWDRSLHSKDEATRCKSIFHTLAGCLGVDVFHNDHRSIPNVCVINMITLIKITVDQNIDLGIDTLKFVTQHFSGIYRQQSKNISWELIAALFRFSNDTFLRCLLGGGDQDQGDYQLGTSLLENLLYNLARGSNEILLLQTSPQFYDGSLEAYEELKSSILYPLMVSFVRTRNTKMLISTWRSELNKAIANYGATSELSILSIWDDNELGTHITQLLQKHVSMQEISNFCCNEIEILKEHVKLEQQGFSLAKLEPQTVYHELYASMTILNSLLSSLSDEGSINDLVTNLPTLVSFLLNLLDGLPECYEMLRCNMLRVLFQVFRVLWWNFDRSDGIVGREQLYRLPWKFGLSIFDRSYNYDDEVNAAEYQSQHVTIYFLVVNWYECFVRGLHIYLQSDFAENLIKYMIGILHTLRAKNSLQSAAELCWNGNSQWIRSLWHLSLANVSIVVRYPQVLNGCDRESRRIFFDDLCILAAQIDLKYAELDFSSGVLYVELLSSLSDWVGSCSIMEIKGDIVLTMTNLIQSALGTTNKVTQRASSIAEDQILRINPLIIGRDHREKILDATLHVKDNQYNKNLVRRLSIAVHLMETRNATAAVCSNSELLWMIAEQIDTFELVDVINALQLQDALTHKILTYILKTQDQPRSKTYLEGFLCILQKILTERKSYLSTIGTLSTINTSIQLLRIHKPLLAEFEQMYVATLLNDLAKVHQGQGSELYLLKHAEIILNILLSSQYNPTHRTQIKIIAKKIFENSSAFSSSLKIMCSTYLYEHDMGLIQAILMAMLKKDYLTGPIHDTYSILSIIIKNEVPIQDESLNITRQLCGKTEDGNFSAQLLVLREVFSNWNVFSQISMAHQEISSFLNWLYDRIPETSEPQVCLLQLDCISAIAMNEGQSVSQWDIENILSLITRTMLASDINYQRDYTNHIFSRFCLIIRILLLSHRSKLRGRHHLLNQCFHTLLAGFFLPYKFNTSSYPQSGVVFLTETSALDKQSAEAFCRILTMWCSPIISSIKRHKSKDELQLTDRAPKMKKYVSKFAINLLEHYCDLQLSGRIKPEIRELILPGIFALLDIMEIEAMKTLNARLNTSAQALWKMLYDEWKKSLQYSS